MAADGDPPQKKDLTGMFSVPGQPPSGQPTTEHTFSAPPAETVDSFDSMVPDMSLPDFQSPPIESALESLPDLSVDASADAPAEPPLLPDLDPLPEPTRVTSDPMDDLRQYSHSVQGSSQLVHVFVPFHLYLSGNFGPYERDKLLLFITENDIGVNSQDLDLQIRAGKVFFARISEFAGIKLIQELRDSGLQFKFIPSERENDEGTHHDTAVEYHYRPESTDTKTQIAIPVLNENSKTLSDYVEIDTIQINQYLKAEIVEAERSDLFQEVIERMLESLKHKARIKGGHALSAVAQEITPLRLPSQYQIHVRATVLKKL